MTGVSYRKDFPEVIRTDVLVAGGGPAGFAAAVAAARNGAKTLLLEKTGTLGGMATSGLVGPFMTCYDNDATEQLVKGIFDEVCVRAEKKGGAIHPSKIKGINPHTSYYERSHSHVTPYQSEIIAVIMDEMAGEAGVDVLFYSQVCDCVTADGGIEYVLASKKEGLCAMKAGVYIDCTGDADLALFAGVDFWMGEKESGMMQPTSLFFEVSGIDRDAFIGELEAHKNELDNSFRNCFCWHVDKAKANGDWTLPRNELGAYEQNIVGRWKINTSRMCGVDGTNTEAISKALIEGRRQVQEIIAFMKKYLPGCENVQLLQVAPSLGVRESRHIVGKYELTTDDVMSRRIFDDAILTFGYGIDIHSHTDGGGEFVTVDNYYTVPYRAMLPQGCNNLLVAGRSICGSSRAAASYRVMPSCIGMGQAVGTAAAQAAKKQVVPENIDIKELQKTLVDQGVVLKTT